MSGQTQDVGEAGPAMDERVCKALGIPGRVEYYAQAPGRECVGWYFADRRSEVEDVVERYTCEYPNGWQAGSTVEEVTCYPRVSEAIAAAWQVVERMRDLGIHISVAPCAGSRRWAAQANRSRPYVHRHESAESAPLAICRAALAALDAA